MWADFSSFPPLRSSSSSSPHFIRPPRGFSPLHAASRRHLRQQPGFVRGADKCDSHSNSRGTHVAQTNAISGCSTFYYLWVKRWNRVGCCSGGVLHSRYWDGGLQEVSAPPSAVEITIICPFGARVLLNYYLSETRDRSSKPIIICIPDKLSVTHCFSLHLMLKVADKLGIYASQLSAWHTTRCVHAGSCYNMWKIFVLTRCKLKCKTAAITLAEEINGNPG